MTHFIKYYNLKETGFVCIVKHSENVLILTLIWFIYY